MGRHQTIVLFGAPGVGKTTIAKILEMEYGYHYFEGDEDLLPEVVELNRNNHRLPNELREKQNELIIQHIVELSKKFSKLVVAYDFMWDRHRVRLANLCPEAKWIMLTLDENSLIKRLDRPGHILTPEFALEIYHSFEKPSIPVVYISNDGKIKDTIAKMGLV